MAQSARFDVQAESCWRGRDAWYDKLFANFHRSSVDAVLAWRLVIGRHVKAQIILQLNVLPNIPLGQGQASGINLQRDLRPHRVKHTPGIRIGFVMKKQSIAKRVRDLFDRMHSSLPNSDDGGIRRRGFIESQCRCWGCCRGRRTRGATRLRPAGRKEPRVADNFASYG